MSISAFGKSEPHEVLGIGGKINSNNDNNKLDLIKIGCQEVDWVYIGIRTSGRLLLTRQWISVFHTTAGTS
jgi:hypothetical protein